MERVAIDLFFSKPTALSSAIAGSLNGNKEEEENNEQSNQSQNCHDPRLARSNDILDERKVEDQVQNDKKQ
jgi:hypothetical protein